MCSRPDKSLDDLTPQQEYNFRGRLSLLELYDYDLDLLTDHYIKRRYSASSVYSQRNKFKRVLDRYRMDQYQHKKHDVSPYIGEIMSLLLIE